MSSKRKPVSPFVWRETADFGRAILQVESSSADPMALSEETDNSSSTSLT
jgi:hypothetical protein